MLKSKSIYFLLALSCMCFVFVSFVLYSSTKKEEIPYPNGYRQWTHVKTAINGPASPITHTGFHHIYANAKAMEGYRTGKFPDGSILVFDVLEATEQVNGNISEGNRKLIDVMIKDTQKYDSTGGWGFEEFKGNSLTDRSILHLAKQKCFNCHAKQKMNDFVFSNFRK